MFTSDIEAKAFPSTQRQLSFVTSEDGQAALHMYRGPTHAEESATYASSSDHDEDAAPALEPTTLAALPEQVQTQQKPAELELQQVQTQKPAETAATVRSVFPSPPILQ